jgi:hypothetical protein
MLANPVAAKNVGGQTSYCITDNTESYTKIPNYFPESIPLLP